MWFVGLIIGGLLGSVGGIGGAFAGAIIGAIVGAAISANKSSAREERLRTIEESMRRLAERIERLELGQPGPGAERPTASAAADAAGGAAAEAALAQATAVERVEQSLPPFFAAMVTEAVEAGATRVAAPAADLSVPVQAPTAAGPTAPAEQVRSEREPTPASARASSESPTPNPLWSFFFGGNALAHIGMIVLFFGVAFLVKYAVERDYIPIELRLMAVAAGAIALLVLGWRLRLKRPAYALMLQGGGIGVLYLTIFAAFRLYQLLPPGLTFALLCAVAVSSAALAILQDSRALAATGVTGGFLAPILASTGGGNHVALFSYYAVLNAGILAIAWYKAWRPLNILGFAFTFLVGLTWGAQYYRPEFFASTEPFLILFFLFYVAIAVLFALRQAPELKHYVDGTIVFGTPLVAFGLQTALVREIEYGAAWSALGVSAIYLVLARTLFARQRQNLRLLVEAFLALGIVFATLAVPLALEGRWTSAAWALEGAAILWVGVRQQRLLARVFAILLQFAAGIAFITDTASPAGVLPVLNSFYLGCLFVSVAGIFCSYYLERHRDLVTEGERVAGKMLFFWGVLWWFGAGMTEIHRHVPGSWGYPPLLVFFATSCLLAGLLWQRLEWQLARLPALAVLPLMVLVMAWDASWPFVSGAHDHPFAHHGYIAWAIAFTVHLWLLRQHEGRGEQFLEWLHAAGLWLLMVLAAWEVGWNINEWVGGKAVWPLIAWALVPGIALMVFVTRGEKLGWPVRAHRDAYLGWGAAPLAAFLLLWSLWTNFVSNGDPAPLPYVPLINPLDLAQVGVFLVIGNWLRDIPRFAFGPGLLRSQTLIYAVLGTAAFIFLNGVLLRSLHHFAGVPFALDAMLRSVLVQASFSIFWSVLALLVMLIATRQAWRALWFIGAALMGIVVAKLFVVDLSNVGGVERIVSFIGVGILMLIIGYLSPVPPKSQEKPS